MQSDQAGGGCAQTEPVFSQIKFNLKGSRGISKPG
jgi:hypothetical protein